MVGAGVNVLTGGTDVHLVLADLRESELDGKQAEDRLDDRQHPVTATPCRSTRVRRPCRPGCASAPRARNARLPGRRLPEVGRVIGETLTGEFSDAQRSEHRADPRAGGKAPALPAAGRARGRRAIFELEGISLARDGRPVLRDVSLSIRSGSTALLGPSGARKSTLLRLLNRLADPDAGTVRFHDTDVRELDPLELRQRVGLVPQLPAPVPGSVADNVCFGPRLRGEEVDPERRSAWRDSIPRSSTAMRRGCRSASSSG